MIFHNTNLCGLSDILWNESTEAEDAVNGRFVKHVLGKETVRKMKINQLVRATVDENVIAATFDLHLQCFFSLYQNAMNCFTGISYHVVISQCSVQFMKWRRCLFFGAK